MFTICNIVMSYYEHLILHTDSDFKVIDWTPFNNNIEGMNGLKIVCEKDLITQALDKLSRHKWFFKQIIYNKKGTHFLCMRKLSKINKLDEYSEKNTIKNNNLKGRESLYRVDDDDKHDTYTTIESNDKFNIYEDF